MRLKQGAQALPIMTQIHDIDSWNSENMSFLFMIGFDYPDQT